MAWTPPPQPTPFNVKPEDVLFLDSETVPKVNGIKDLDEYGRNVFVNKFSKEITGSTEKTLEDFWLEKAALHCEFNKIACVTMGVFSQGEQGQRTLRVKSFFGYNEQIILRELAPKLGKAKYLCAHNGKKFDFPLLARKYVQYGIEIPSILNVTGVKPWDVAHFDTMEVWGFNDIRSFTSLDALAYMFGLPSPKKDMDGAGVAGIYYGPSKMKDGELPWEDSTLRPVAEYCEGDVITLANVYLRLINEAPVSTNNIVVV